VVIRYCKVNIHCLFPYLTKLFSFTSKHDLKLEIDKPTRKNAESLSATPPFKWTFLNQFFGRGKIYQKSKIFQILGTFLAFFITYVDL